MAHFSLSKVLQFLMSVDRPQTSRKLAVVKVGKRALAEALSEGKAGLKRFKVAICVAAPLPLPSASKRNSPVLML